MPQFLAAVLILSSSLAVLAQSPDTNRDKPKPAPWQPINEGYGYSSIPDHQGKGNIAVDAAESPKVVNLSKVGGEHRMELEFKRTTEEGHLAIAFPVGSESCTLVLDGFQKEGPLCGIDWVKGVPLTDKENPTARKGKLLETGKLHQLKIEVRRRHILVELDANKIVDARLGPDDVGGSHLFYPPNPADIGLKAFDGKFVLTRYDHRIITIDPRKPEDFPADIRQVPCPGAPADASNFALKFGQTFTLKSEKDQLVNHQAPFTIEYWMKQARDDNEWFLIMSGPMKSEMRKIDVFNRWPEMSLADDSGGISGQLPGWDAKWHHVALSNDEYYTNLYFDGKFVCRAVNAYFGRNTANKPLQFGSRPGGGDRRKGFEGQLRELRISNIDRYPRSKPFDPPAILGYDEHVTCQLDLREGKLDLRPVAANLGEVIGNGEQVEIVKAEK